MFILAGCFARAAPTWHLFSIFGTTKMIYFSAIKITKMNDL